MADDYSLASLPRLLKLINDENANANLTANTVSISDPTLQTMNGKNTVVQVTGIAGRGRSGTRPYYYDRLDLATFFQEYLDQPPGPLLITINGAVSTFDLLPRLRAMYDIGIAQNDIINEALTGINHILKAKPQSLAWIGQVELNIQPLLTELSTLLTVLSLPLFTPTIFDTTSAEQLLARINLINGTSFTFDDVEFTGFLPVPGHDLTYPEVIIQVTGKPTALLTGTVNIRYTRRNAIDIYPTPITTSYPFTVIASENDLLSALSTYDDVVLEGEEVNRTTVGIDPDFETLTANQYSLLWTNGSNFVFNTPKIPLSQSAMDVNWEGLFASDVTSIYYQQTDLLTDLVDADTHLIDDGFSIRLGLVTDITPSDEFLLDSFTLASNVGGGNTSVTLMATATNTRYTGSTTVNFNRVDAADAFVDAVDVTSIGNISGTTTRAVLSQINASINTGINPLWIQDNPIDETETALVLTFIEGQFVFIPGTSFTMTIARASGGIPEGAFMLDNGGYLILDNGGYLILD